MIYFTSDLHFGHNKEFVYVPRGFKTVAEMNETIIKNWNEIVTKDDDVYILGDLMLGDNEAGMECLKRLNGKLHIILGNHDTTTREMLYSQLENVVEIHLAMKLKIGKQSFYLSHYPTFTSNLEKSDRLPEHVINLYGHTHQHSNFYQEISFMYHVGVDSHHCKPVSAEQIIEDIKAKIEKCKTYLD